MAETILYTDLKMEFHKYGIILHIDDRDCSLSHSEAEWLWFMDYGLLPYRFGQQNVREYRFEYVGGQL